MILSIALASGFVASGGSKAVAIAAFLLTAGWCFVHQRVDHTLVVLALYLGLLDGYIKLSTGSSSITLARDALVIAIAAGALLRSSQARERISLPPLGGFVVAFTVVVLVELANPSARGNLVTSLAGARQHLEFVPLFFLGFAFVRTTSQIRVVLLVLAFCASIGGVVSYIQSTLTPDQLAAWGPGYAERINGTGNFVGSARVAFGANSVNFVRPFGLGSEVGAGAFVAALALPGLIALLMMASVRMRWVVASLSLGIGLAVATSGSRTGQVIAFVTLLAFGLLAATSRNAVKAVLGSAVAVAIIYGAFVQLGADNTSAKRAQSLAPTKAVSTFTRERGGSVSLFGNLVGELPLGAGLATVGPASGFRQTGPETQLNAETQWNYLVIETGVAGVVIFAAFLLRLIWLAATRIRHFLDDELRLYLAALAAPIIGLLAGSFAGPVTAGVPSAPFLWFAAGVLAYWLVTAYPGLRREAPPLGS